MQFDDCAYRALQPALNSCTAAAKISDFGMSRCMHRNRSHASNVRQGTPFYTAPEVLRRGELRQASDAFSFGVVMWEVMAGRPVFTLRCAHCAARPLCCVLCAGVPGLRCSMARLSYREGRERRRARKDVVGGGGGGAVCHANLGQTAAYVHFIRASVTCMHALRIGDDLPALGPASACRLRMWWPLRLLRWARRRLDSRSTTSALPGRVRPSKTHGELSGSALLRRPAAALRAA